jgi:hypothetical protein
VPSSLTPEQRTMRARIAAHTSWARTEDPSARTKPAREAFLDRFRREVDPDGKLSETERERRARHAMKAHMQRLALRSAKVRSGGGAA